MKTIFYSLVIVLLFICQHGYSQMADGQYTYANNEVTFKLTIADGGWTISSATVIVNATQKTLTGKGYYRKGGNFFWYEFEANDGCSFSFDEPKANMKLQLCCCTNGVKDADYTLTRKSN